jgi:NAD(P)-dependent dehydrogenase (short-subunit alcohol dehydrogenase family)
MELDGTAAIVTGGASGIGEACARALARRGCRCVVDVNAGDGAKVASDIGGAYAHADVADPGAVRRAVEAACALAPLRTLVNAAGIPLAERTIDRTGTPHELDSFERVLRVNLVGTFNVLRIAAAAMATTDPVDEDGVRGAVVNITSIAAFDGQIGQAAYAASKAGVVGMTLPIARDLSAVGIRVNTLAPGMVDTPIYGFQGDKADTFKQALARNVLFPKRIGRPQEIASMVLELLTNDYVNGEVIRVDAGARLPPR